MSWLLRESPDALAAGAARVARATGIPMAHVEKDFWVTEVLPVIHDRTVSRRVGSGLYVMGLRQPILPPTGQRLPRFGGADPVTGKIEEQPADEAGADQELNTLQSLDRGCRRSSGGAGDQAETTSAAW